MKPHFLLAASAVQVLCHTDATTRPSPPLSAPPTRGEWHGDVWFPNNGKIFTTQDARTLLRGSHISFIGDSLGRRAATTLASFVALPRQSIEQASHEPMIDKDASVEILRKSNPELNITLTVQWCPTLEDVRFACQSNATRSGAIVVIAIGLHDALLVRPHHHRDEQVPPLFNTSDARAGHTTKEPAEWTSWGISQYGRLAINATLRCLCKSQSPQTLLVWRLAPAPDCGAPKEPVSRCLEDSVPGYPGEAAALHVARLHNFNVEVTQAMRQWCSSSSAVAIDVELELASRSS